MLAEDASTSLGKWVSKQRDRMREGRLMSKYVYRLTKLNEVRFVWNTKFSTLQVLPIYGHSYRLHSPAMKRLIDENRGGGSDTARIR
jgi:hypothetical protein